MPYIRVTLNASTLFTSIAHMMDGKIFHHNELVPCLLIRIEVFFQNIHVTRKTHKNIVRI